MLWDVATGKRRTGGVLCELISTWVILGCYVLVVADVSVFDMIRKVYVTTYTV